MRPLASLLASITAVSLLSTPAGATTAGYVSQLAPLGREGHAAICDSVRDRMLLVTGSDGILGYPGVYARPLDGSGEWERLLTGDGPGRRDYSTIVLDSVHDRLVLFGGRAHATSGPYYNDVWLLPLGGGGSWTLLTPSGTPPSARSGAAGVFDAVIGKLYLHGGDQSDENDLWTLSLGASPAWQKIDLALPLPRRFLASGILDPVRRRMIVHGGSSGSASLDETWFISLDDPAAGWSRIFTAGPVPPGRRGHVAVYEPVLDAMLIYGGAGGSEVPVAGDVWKLSLSGTPEWSIASPEAAGPGTRSRLGAFFDRTRSRMVTVGGNVFSRVTARIDAFSTAGGFTWSVLDASDLLDYGTIGASSFYDPIRDRLVVVGGRINGPRALAINFQGYPAWTEVAVGSVQMPSGRAGTGGAYDPVRDRFLIFGGATAATLSGFPGWPPFVAELWSLGFTPADHWSPVPHLNPPSARVGTVMCYDPPRDRMILFGGSDQVVAYNTVYELPLSGPQALTWSLLAVTGTPPAARAGATMIYDAAHDRMIVGGGRGSWASGAFFDDVWTLSLGAPPAWALVGPIGTPPTFGVNPGFYDPLRDRFVVRAREATDERCLISSLDLDPVPTWTTEVPAGDRNPSYNYASIVYDAGRDRANTYGGEFERRTLFATDFGQPTLPRLTSAGEQGWTSGEVNVVPFTVTNPFAFGQIVDWTARDDRGWVSVSASGLVVVPALDSAIIQVAVPVPDSAAIGVNRIQLGAMLRTTQQYARASVSLHDATTAARVSLASATAEPGRVRIAWTTTSRGEPLAVERSRGTSAWQTVQAVAPDAGGWIRFEDTDVEPGVRYGYRLRIGDAVEGEAWVEVPRAADFALVGARPNPAADDVKIAFHLPGRAPARLELLDLAGRVARSVDLAHPQAGAHLVPLDPRRELPAGLYFARLTQGGLRQIRRVTIVR